MYFNTQSHNLQFTLSNIHQKNFKHTKKNIQKNKLKRKKIRSKIETATTTKKLDLYFLLFPFLLSSVHLPSSFPSLFYSLPRISK